MRLINKTTGKELRVDDIVETFRGEKVRVLYFRKPHKPASVGKVSVQYVGKTWTQELFVSAINCEWIEREDRISDRFEDDQIEELQKSIKSLTSGEYLERLQKLHKITGALLVEYESMIGDAS